jgi:nucleoside-diphosphate-sugar epimerase
MKYDKDYWNDVGKVVTCIPNLANLKNKRIFITGSTGMICSAVVEILYYLNSQLNFNMQITLGGRSKDKIEQRFPFFLEGKSFSFCYYDAQQDSDLNNVIADYVIHGASLADPNSLIHKPVEAMLCNLNGLVTLLKLVKDHNPKSRLLFISSSEVYGNKTRSGPALEDDYGYVDLLNPRACYPSSKRAAETLCASYAYEYGVDSVIARPGHIYGPSILPTDSRASAQFTRNAVAGKDIVMKSLGNQLRSYCYTLDCAAALISILLNGKTCEAYNISNPDSIVSIKEFAATIAETAGCKMVFSAPDVQESKSYNLMDNSSLNSDKLFLLGWRPFFDLQEGVRKTLKYCLK